MDEKAAKREVIDGQEFEVLYLHFQDGEPMRYSSKPLGTSGKETTTTVPTVLGCVLDSIPGKVSEKSAETIGNWVKGIKNMHDVRERVEGELGIYWTELLIPVTPSMDSGEYISRFRRDLQLVSAFRGGGDVKLNIKNYISGLTG